MPSQEGEKKNGGRYAKHGEGPNALQEPNGKQGAQRNIPPGQEQTSKEQSRHEPNIPDRIIEQTMDADETRNHGKTPRSRSPTKVKPRTKY